jgi:hypothetical protein
MLVLGYAGHQRHGWSDNASAQAPLLPPSRSFATVRKMLCDCSIYTTSLSVRVRRRSL